MVNPLYKIKTPEGIEFEYSIAAPLLRLGAWLVDQMCIWSFIAGVNLFLGFFSSFGSKGADIRSALMYLAMFAAQWTYFILFEWLMHGQTIGKRLLGLRVIDDNGLGITFSQALIRNLVRPVDFLPFGYFLGGLVIMLDRSQRRLGDMAAGTLVVNSAELMKPKLLNALQLRYNSYLREQALHSRVNKHMTPEELELLVDLIARRESLPLQVRMQLFEQAAKHIHKRFRIKRPQHLSAEKFVMNIAALALLH